VSATVTELLTLHFPRYLGNLSSFTNVCSDLSDEEAVQTTAHFFGICWEDIDPKRWETKPSSTTFFTPEAMRYYLPALIRCSLEDPARTEMAIDGIIFELEQAVVGARGEWRDSRWMILSVEQMETVSMWLHSLNGSEDEDFDRRISKALQTLSDFRDRKQNGK